MTIAMLALAGIPGTVGFIGKFQLIHALVDGDYTWLGDRARDRLDDLARLLPAGVATIWMSPAVRVPVPATGSGRSGADRRRLPRGRRAGGRHGRRRCSSR